MKYFLLILPLLYMMSGLAHAASDEWFPYYFPADPAKAQDYMGVPASTFNAGKDVLDAPAGKHGFVKVKNGHFYFEDGIRAKFWGTNLCFGACFPDHKQAEITANRIAYFGFNAVRLHHMDMFFEPNGIFEDVAPAYKNKQMKPTGHLSPRQLDKLDYLIYQLKQRGIYIDMNTLVSRFFTEADGVPDAEKLGMAAKPYSLFDSKLIELQKQYDKDLLTHYNPYTKLRYCDDPAVCLVEITNENSIVELNPSSLPEYYQKELNDLFNKWLADKYGSIERAQNLWKPKDNLTPDFLKWSIEQHRDAKMTLQKSGDGVATLTIQKITDTNWHLQYRYSGIKLIKNKGYVLKFTAKANKELPIDITCQQGYAPWEWLGLSGNIPLDKEFKTFEIAFYATADCENAKIVFIIGNSEGVITIKNVVLSDNGKAVDMKYFLTDLEKKYLTTMKKYIHNELGVKIPVGVGGHWNPDQFKTQQVLDYMDKHVYWDHPLFPHQAWDLNDFRINNKSLLLEKDLGIISVLKIHKKNYTNLKILEKPFTLTEWNHCYPNQYAYETPLPLADEAKKNDWDALFQFAWSHSTKDLANYDNIDSYFNINPNAQQLILCSFASRIFLGNVIARSAERGDEAISVIPAKAGIQIVIASPEGAKQSIFVGETKNTDSGWNALGRFDWGTAPTLLKQP